MDYISMVFISYFDHFKCSNMVILAQNAVVHFVMYYVFCYVLRSI